MYIQRRFKIISGENPTENKELSQADFLASGRLLIVLGGHGSGESTWADQLCKDSDGECYFFPADFPTHGPSISKYHCSSRPITIIDHRFLFRLDRGGNILPFLFGNVPFASRSDTKFIITCRTNLWNGLLEICIKDIFGIDPIIGELLPLTPLMEEDITDFINQHETAIQPDDFIKQAKEKGVFDLLTNPRNLEYLLQTVKKDG